MSKSFRDQRSRPHSGKKCPEAKNGGCVYCVTGEYKLPARRSERHGRQGKRAAIQASLNESLGTL